MRRHGGDLVQLLPLLLPAKVNFEERKDQFQIYFDRTKELYKLFQKIPNIELMPTIPKTNMFHLYVKGKPDRLVKANDLIVKQIDLSIIRASWGERKTGWTCVEVYVGENALDVDDQKIIEYFRLLEQLMAEN